MSSRNLQTPGSGPNNRAYRVIGFTLLFLILAAVVFIFVKTIVFDQPMNDQAIRQALVAASVGVTVSCLIAWVLDLLQIINLQPGSSKILWTVIIASILGSSAVVYQNWSKETDVISIACIRPVTIDEASGQWVRPIAAKNFESHKRGAIFGFLVAVTNLQTDSSGNYELELRFEFEDRTNKAAFIRNSYSGNAKKLKDDPLHRKMIAEYKSAMSDCIQDNMIEMLVRTNLRPIDTDPGES